MRSLLAAAVVAVLAAGSVSAGHAVVARDAKGPGTRVRLPAYAVSVYVPRGWYMTYERINGVVDPVTLFTATTFPLRARPQSSGLCSRALQRAWREDGAYVQVTEERDGASRKRMLRRVQKRPDRFRLDAHGAGGLCTPPNSGLLTFQEGGRAFYVFYGFARRASQKTHADARALLQSLRIAARSRR